MPPVSTAADDEQGHPDPLAARSASTSLKRARILFGGSSGIPIVPPTHDPTLHRSVVARRIAAYYPVVPDDGDAAGGKRRKGSSGPTARAVEELREESLRRFQTDSSERGAAAAAAGRGTLVLHREQDLVGDGPLSAGAGGGGADFSGVLALPGQKVATGLPPSASGGEVDGGKAVKPGGILVKKSPSARVPTPKWHAPWRLSAVLSSHLGWVRSIAFDPTNDIFATGSADRTIKVFDLAKSCVGAEDALKITLTGHIGPVRGLAFSERHPYLFSAGEDKMVKCWDLETNQVIRHYHGHLSGVFDLRLHPTLDLLVTGGRDAVARVWDMRSKKQVHCLTGHDNTVGALLTKTTDPQIITGSYDSTIKLWDLVAGKCMSTLTHHKKSIRALARPSFENTFLSGAADTLKKWQGKDGRFIKNLTGHNAVINALAINDDGVAVSAADDGTLNFWDYGTGYCFQNTETIAQPGSLDAENGIFAVEFDLTGTRLITGEADKTVKIWKQDEASSEITHPIDMAGWRRKCLREAKQRY